MFATTTLKTTTALLLSLLALTIQQSPSAAARPAVSARIPMTKTLVDFSDRSAAGRWFTSSDAVMGGVSTSRATIAADGWLVFSGTVRLENNGGFATVSGSSADPNGDDLRGADAVRLTVRGDGRTYQLWLYTGSRRLVHVARFPTRAGARETITLPFAAFRAENGFGRPVTAPPLRDPVVTGYRLLISDKQKGDFSLAVSSIVALRQPTASPSLTPNP
jgi:hypothetical protein